MFRDEAEECPEFIASFLDALHNQQEVPQQLDLLYDFTQGEPAIIARDPRAAISSSKAPAWPPPERYKVEVWRESKRKRRFLKIKKIQ